MPTDSSFADPTETPPVPDTPVAAGRGSRWLVARLVGGVVLLALAAMWWWTRPAAPPRDVARRLPVHSDFRSQAVFSSNSQHLAVGSGTGAVDFWKTDDWSSPVAAPLTQQPITCLAATPDGHLLAGTLGERAIVWTWKSLDARLISPLPDIPTSLAAHPTKLQIACGLKNGKVWRLDTADGLSTTVDFEHVGACTGLAFGGGGAWLASSGADGSVRVRFESPETKPIVKKEHAASVVGIAVAGERALTADWNGQIRLWNTREWSVVRVESLSAGMAEGGASATLSSDSCSHVALTEKFAAVGSFGGTVVLLSPATGERIREFACGYPVQALALSPDSRFLATAGPGRFVDIRDLDADERR
jgi:WD40 repeat protein